MSTQYDLSIHAGETRALVVTVVDSAGADVDITAAEITYMLALSTPVTKTLGDGITVTDAAGGEFEIAINQADTVSIDAARNLQHECKVLLPSGAVLTVFYGFVKVLDSLIGTLPEAP